MSSTSVGSALLTGLEIEVIKADGTSVVLDLASIAAAQELLTALSNDGFLVLKDAVRIPQGGAADLDDVRKNKYINAILAAGPDEIFYEKELQRFSAGERNLDIGGGSSDLREDPRLLEFSAVYLGGEPDVEWVTGYNSGKRTPVRYIEARIISKGGDIVLFNNWLSRSTPRPALEWPAKANYVVIIFHWFGLRGGAPVHRRA